MRIGIDLDWTLADHGQFWADFFGVERKLKRHEIHHFVSSKVFEAMNMAPEHLWMYGRPELSDPMWPKAINLLRRWGFEVYVVSNQSPMIYGLVEDWLSRHGIVVDGIELIGPESEKWGFNVLVDDSVEKIFAVIDDVDLGMLWSPFLEEDGIASIRDFWDKVIDRVRLVTSAMDVVRLIRRELLTEVERL